MYSKVLLTMAPRNVKKMKLRQLQKAGPNGSSPKTTSKNSVSLVLSACCREQNRPQRRFGACVPQSSAPEIACCAGPRRMTRKTANFTKILGQRNSASANYFHDVHCILERVGLANVANLLRYSYVEVVCSGVLDMNCACTHDG